MNAEELTKLGLTKAEALIYCTVLKLGRCTVKDVAKEAGFHRTIFYDVLEQLKEKGLVGFSKAAATTHYEVSDVNKLYEFLSEKKEYLDKIFPELKKLQETLPNPVNVIVYKGLGGMKTAFRDMLRENNPIFGFGSGMGFPPKKRKLKT